MHLGGGSWAEIGYEKSYTQSRKIEKNLLSAVSVAGDFAGEFIAPRSQFKWRFDVPTI